MSRRTLEEHAVRSDGPEPEAPLARRVEPILRVKRLLELVPDAALKRAEPIGACLRSGDALLRDLDEFNDLAVRRLRGQLPLFLVTSCISPAAARSA